MEKKGRKIFSRDTQQDFTLAANGLSVTYGAPGSDKGETVVLGDNNENLRGAIASPTLRIDGMTVAGE